MNPKFVSSVEGFKAFAETGRAETQQALEAFEKSDPGVALEIWEAARLWTQTYAMIPRVSEPVAWTALAKMSAEYNYPSNPANCARYGWEAARRYLRDLNGLETPEPLTKDWMVVKATEYATAFTNPHRLLKLRVAFVDAMQFAYSVPRGPNE